MIYEKWGGGQFASGPIRKVGGGSPLQVRYLCLAHRKYFINGYNFDQGGGGGGGGNLIVVFKLYSFFNCFILKTEGGVPPLNTPLRLRIVILEMSLRAFS